MKEEMIGLGLRNRDSVLECGALRAAFRWVLGLQLSFASALEAQRRAKLSQRTYQM